jgi:putative Holliday junction resolvase
MRVLGIDYGRTRVGLALSDETGTIAQSLCYCDGGSDKKVVQAVLQTATERGAGKIVVGVPVKLNNAPSPQTERTLQFVAALQAATTLPVQRWDERLTTVQAQRVLIEGNVRRKDRREKIDQLAAQIMLQSYLDATNPQPSEE